MIELFGWLGNLFLVIGFLLVARRNNLGQLSNAIGCIFYVLVAILSRIYSLFFLELLLGIISIVGFIKWRKNG